MRCCGGWTRSGGCQSHTLCPTPTSTAAARRTGQGAPAPQTCAPRTCAPHPPVSPAQGLRAGGGSGHVASKRYSPSIATPHTCAPHTLSCTHKCKRCKTVGGSGLEDIRAHQYAPHTHPTLYPHPPVRSLQDRGQVRARRQKAVVPWLAFRGWCEEDWTWAVGGQVWSG